MNPATVVNGRQKKKRGTKSERRGEERKQKEIVNTAVSLLNPCGAAKCSAGKHQHAVN